MATPFKMKGSSLFKKKTKEPVVTTRTKTSITKSKDGVSSVYKMDKEKTKINEKTGTTSYTFTNKHGNSINEVHSSDGKSQTTSRSSKKRN